MKFKVSIKLKNGEIRNLHNVKTISKDIGFIGFGGIPIIEFIREDGNWQNVKASEVDNIICEIQNDEKCECCGNCKWNEYSPDADGWRNGKFYCSNEESEYCGIPISYDDSCENWKANDKSTKY